MKKKSTWMKGFVIPPKTDDLKLSQAESKAQIVLENKTNRSFRRLVVK